MQVAVVGTGYVGLTTGVALAYLGHEVVGIDIDENKVTRLSSGRSPIYEPGLEDLLSLSRSRIKFTTDIALGVADADVVFIAVGTPALSNGAADTRFVEQAAAAIAHTMSPGRVYTVVVKSTVPLGTNLKVARIIRDGVRRRGVEVKVHFASNPEFLREGLALQDTLYPDRIVVGTVDDWATSELQNLYKPILDQDFVPPPGLPRPAGYVAPAWMVTDPNSAEMIKYAANSFLALKISFANEIAGLCELVGADIQDVTRGIGMDSRIGERFLGAGIGWGGSCFPKDTLALISVGREYDYAMPILEAARMVNTRQRLAVIRKLQTKLKVIRGRTIGVLGLAFKPNTDDVRESPALEIVNLLRDHGATVRVHDPLALENARKVLQGESIEFVDDPYELAVGCDALVLATEWTLYKSLDLKLLASMMRNPILIDGRNALDREEVRGQGFIYVGVGR
jgi:UDPglucose 6-dehydrogenase